MLTIHYHRYDGRYDRLDLWVWDKTGQRQLTQQAIRPAGVDDFGPYFEIPTRHFTVPKDEIEFGFIVRSHGNWETRDGGDRSWRMGWADRIWLVSNDPQIHVAPPDISPRVETAHLDGAHRITARLSHAAEYSTVHPDFFDLEWIGKGRLAVTQVEVLEHSDLGVHLVALTVGEELFAGKSYSVSAEGYRAAEVLARDILLDPQRYFSDVELGAICTPEATRFRLFSPTAGYVNVVLYDEPVGEAGRRDIEMKEMAGGLWEAVVDGDLHERPYMFSVDGEEVVDIHSRCNTDFDGRGRVIDLRRTDPDNFRPIRRPHNIDHPTDAVIWEVHVRDLTIHKSSGVEAEKRGLYLGAASRGTKSPEKGVATCIEHLLDLGVTHVQLLPIQDFANREQEEFYNWGYMPVNFSSPEGWYATNKRDASRVRECKEMIQAFHDAGLRVVMDVVYNHTDPSSAFEESAPGYYYRRRPNGTLWNGSGCGNEFRSEAPMARKFIVDSCRYWAEEFGVDGFRFDLMGLIDPETMRAVREAVQAIDPTLLVYGEPWAATGPDGMGLGRITDKGMASHLGVGAFNDGFRNAIKGSPDGAGRGFVHDGSGRDAIKAGIHGAIGEWAAQPAHAIQYVTCHDNLTLWDKNHLACPDEDTEQLMRMQVLSIGILAVSQGVMFLHGGCEFARTKFGNHNSYNAPDSINRIDWERKAAFERVYQYTRGMVHLRRKHPVFRLRTREEIVERVHFVDALCPNEKAIAMTLNGKDLPGESWNKATVLINANPTHQPFGLPDGHWSVYSYSGTADEQTLVQMHGKVTVPGRSLMVLAQHT